jgi:hypothetical protein
LEESINRSSATLYSENKSSHVEITKKEKEKSLIMQEPGVEEWQAHIGHTAVRWKIENLWKGLGLKFAAEVNKNTKHSFTKHSFFLTFLETLHDVSGYVTVAPVVSVWW